MMQFLEFLRYVASDLMGAGIFLSLLWLLGYRVTIEPRKKRRP